MINSVKQLFKKNKLILKIYVKVTYKIATKKIEKYGYKVLNELNHVMKEIDHIYFLDYGVLLGFIREGKFLSHDPDIDISIIYKNDKTYESVDQALTQAGFVKIYSKLKRDVIVLETYEKYGIEIDIFYYFNTDKMSYAYSTYVFKERVYKQPYDRSILKYEYSLIDDTVLKRWENFEFPIPRNHLQTIIEKYGDDWRIPKKSWSIDDYKNTVKDITDDGIFIDLRKITK